MGKISRDTPLAEITLRRQTKILRRIFEHSQSEVEKWER